MYNTLEAVICLRHREALQSAANSICVHGQTEATHTTSKAEIPIELEIMKENRVKKKGRSILNILTNTNQVQKIKTSTTAMS